MKPTNLLVVVFVVFSIAACSAGRQTLPDKKSKIKGDRELVSHSEGIEPLWIQECPERTDHTLPYCGESVRQASQKLACSEAYADALVKLRLSVGQKVDAKLAPDGQGGYKFEIQGASEPITIRGAWEDQRWFEEYQGPSGRSYDCYVMLVYPMLEYENLIGMARKAAGDKVLKATELRKEGQQLAANGRHADAVVRLKRAKSLLDSLKEPVISPDGSLNSTLLKEQVVADLNKSTGEAGKTDKTAMVVVQIVLDEKKASTSTLARSVLTQVKGWLSDKGVRIRPGGLAQDQVTAVLSGDQAVAANAAALKGAGLLLVINIESEYLGQEEGFHYAQAIGAYRLIRTSDGRELASSDLGPEKQGHPASRRAAIKLCVEKLRDKLLGNIIRESLSKI
ncbi:MAG: hypothetical protein JRJ87_12955 [Deltaproteobacteria bacterium]|nr:hypothetical protein [Deltaproteobacteria bacterium]